MVGGIGIPWGFLFLWVLYPQLRPINATPVYHLDNLLSIIEELEDQDPTLTILKVAEILRDLQTSDQDLRRLLLGETSVPVVLPRLLSHTNLSFLEEVLNHQAGPLTETGVVLTPDGTTVAVGNLVAGIEAGLKREVSQPLSGVSRDLSAPVDNLCALTLAKDLGLAFLSHHMNKSQELLGPDGCWDSVDSPHVFTGSGPWTPATSALINGGMDGFILGDLLSQFQAPLPKLSSVLRDYYGQVPSLLLPKASSRRKNFEATFDLGNFTSQVLSAVSLLDHLRNNLVLHQLNLNTFRKISEQGVKQFYHSYLECPAIIPRCMWAARPFRGEPVELALPLRYVYIHHTFEPSRPCTSFQECAADMRSMQRFHQDERQWNDIGYKRLESPEPLSKHKHRAKITHRDHGLHSHQ
ncbi:N-acetylmuramoyl-L-alanine amidase-like isoform X2 [Pristis pectinata]|uniref:N-acetylmuramoyl-L-alanine amidase-like isoform X2 n=1 Tax=Pristis pectinata TaxID=685728 RepID=UPI00223D96AE|nr:N-acetylmuramoyl-L-alanine amidase-like isoform X2 [Pristis pectinata]